MPTVNAQGDLTADGTEQTVWDVTTNKWFKGYVDLENMASGDTVILRRYLKIRSTGVATLVIEDKGTYTNEQVDKKIITFAPMGSDVQYKVTLEQTVGTIRVFPWKLFE
jgi:hypothetical protein